MPDEILSPPERRRRALVEAIDAYLKGFNCFLVADPRGDACWHVVDTTDQRVVIAELRDLEAFAKLNGIAVPE